MFLTSNISIKGTRY